MPLIPATTEDMDGAADIAENDLKKIFSKDEIKKFSEWWARHYLKAGHKRLGRMLVAISKGK